MNSKAVSSQMGQKKGDQVYDVAYTSTASTVSKPIDK